MIASRFPFLARRGQAGVLALAVLAASLTPCLVSAANTTTRSKPPQIPIPVVDPKPAQKARDELHTARTALSHAEDELNAVIARLKAAYESSGEFASASAARKQAQDEYDAASKPVLAALSARPDYQAALKAKTAAQQQMAAMRAAAASS